MVFGEISVTFGKKRADKNYEETKKNRIKCGLCQKRTEQVGTQKIIW